MLSFGLLCRCSGESGGFFSPGGEKPIAKKRGDGVETKERKKNAPRRSDPFHEEEVRRQEAENQSCESRERVPTHEDDLAGGETCLQRNSAFRRTEAVG
jgi:hypothetical protein